MTEVEALKDGDLVQGAGGWCDLCRISFGGSMSPRDAKSLDGKLYHPTCYPKAVEIFLADKKLHMHEASQTRCGMSLCMHSRCVAFPNTCQDQKPCEKGDCREKTG